MTLRLPADLHQRAMVAARAEGSTFTAFARAALEDALDRRRADPAFQRRLAELRAAEAAAFRKLSAAEPESGP
jgi:hypothetical protein